MPQSSCYQHIKIVSKALSTIATIEIRDGLIRQQYRSGKLILTYDSKKDFNTDAK